MKLKINDLVSLKEFKVYNNINNDYIINKMYQTDLLSIAMTNVTDDSVFITLINNLNSLAVASLNDCKCVLITNTNNVDQKIIDKASQEDITILSTDLDNVSTILKISSLNEKV